MREELRTVHKLLRRRTGSSALVFWK
uniref:Uncharacterized protein n=1 Tax=Anguilla anguilla TaxID=7936 RepID=A0A0E9TRV3_ANGAN